MNKAILGIDISKEYFDVCLISGGKDRYRKFDNNINGFFKLSQFLKKEQVEQMHAAMEATGRLYENLALYLVSEGFTVSVVNPKCIKGFAQSELQRSKTDKKDAGVIARFCKANSPKMWQPPAPEIRELQEMMRYRDSLIVHINQEKRRLDSGLTSSTVKAVIEQHVESLERQVRELEKVIGKHVKEHPRLLEHYKLLTTIIGVGDIVACTYLAEIGYSDQFKRSRQVESYCGLAPREFKSGSSVRGRGRISKVGNSHMRKVLYMPALTAKSLNPVLRSLADRLEKAGKPKKVIICAVMRKMVRLMYAVVSTGKPFDLHYTPGPIDGFTFADEDDEYERSFHNLRDLEILRASPI